MTTTKTRTKTEKQSVSQKTQAKNVVLNKIICHEISRLAELYGIKTELLGDFAQFVIENHKKKDPKVSALTLAQLKAAIYNYFEVSNTKELKLSGSFRMAIDGMTNLNLSSKADWEALYREFIGILPNEEDQKGYGCINGVNIFNYFKPWRVFGLNPIDAQLEDIKRAYRELSKIYHPDIPETGDAKVFERISIMYKSISAEA